MWSFALVYEEELAHDGIGVQVSEGAPVIGLPATEQEAVGAEGGASTHGVSSR
jgi:hypothetical protein